MAQDSAKVITERPAFLGVSYLQGDRNLTKNEMEQILFSSRDPVVVNLAETEQSYTTAAFVPAFLGGFCVGFGAFAKPVNPTLIVAGIIAIAGGYALQSAGDADLHRAIARYDSDVLSPPPVGWLNRSHPVIIRVGFSAGF